MQQAPIVTAILHSRVMSNQDEITNLEAYLRQFKSTSKEWKQHRLETIKHLNETARFLQTMKVNNWDILLLVKVCFIVFVSLCCYLMTPATAAGSAVIGIILAGAILPGFPFGSRALAANLTRFGIKAHQAKTIEKVLKADEEKQKELISLLCGTKNNTVNAFSEPDRVHMLSGAKVNVYGFVKNVVEKNIHISTKQELGKTLQNIAHELEKDLEEKNNIIVQEIITKTFELHLSQFTWKKCLVGLIFRNIKEIILIFFSIIFVYTASVD